ncbi:MAG TPA: C39 family peptidase [Candidatus Obscuribacterales bacterium]
MKVLRDTNHGGAINDDVRALPEIGLAGLDAGKDGANKRGGKHDAKERLARKIDFRPGGERDEKDEDERDRFKALDQEQARRIKEIADELRELNKKLWRELRKLEGWDDFLRLWRQLADMYPDLFDWKRLLNGDGGDASRERGRAQGASAGERMPKHGAGATQGALAYGRSAGDGGGHSGGGSASGANPYQASSSGGYSTPGYGGDGGGATGYPAEQWNPGTAGQDYSQFPTDAANVPWQRPGNFGDLSIAGPPTISAAQINDILAEAGSPVAGQGEQIYSMCVKAGIDPAIALGFFFAESSAGTDGLAVQTKSWGNIRDPKTGGFVSYPSFLDGLQDWLDLMNDLYLAPESKGGFGVSTVDEAIPIYAPSSDGNNPSQYIETMRSRVAGWRQDAFSDKYKDQLPTTSDSSAASYRGPIGLNDNTLDFFFTQFKTQYLNNGLDGSNDCGPASLAMVFKRFGFSPNGVDLNNTPQLISDVRLLMTGTRAQSYTTADGQVVQIYTDTDQVVNVARRMDPSAYVTTNFSEVDSALKQGKMIVMAGNPGPYNSGMTTDQYARDMTNGGVYTGGHFITVVAGNGGQFLIHDPASKIGPLIVSRSQLEGYFNGPQGGAMVIIGPPR